MSSGFVGILSDTHISGKKEHGGLVARHDQFSGHRVSITAVTSSWSDGTAGPLGLCIPRGMMSDAEIQSFNSNHRGRCFIFSSERRTHYMNGETFLVLLKGLDAYAIQRRKHKLADSIRGLLLTDGWTGFHSWSSGLDLAREAWSSSVNVSLRVRKCRKSISKGDRVMVLIREAGAHPVSRLTKYIRF